MASWIQSEQGTYLVNADQIVSIALTPGSSNPFADALKDEPLDLFQIVASLSDGFSLPLLVDVTEQEAQGALNHLALILAYQMPQIVRMAEVAKRLKAEKPDGGKGQVG